MSKLESQISIKVSDKLYEILNKKAQRKGTNLTNWARIILVEQLTEEELNEVYGEENTLAEPNAKYNTKSTKN